MGTQQFDLLRLADEQRSAALKYVQNDVAFPVWHIAAPVGRINDPNGLVYWRGKYHAFYQWGPYAPDIKVVYWGHAVSDDLIHWTHEPPAIAPDHWYDKDGCYSGSAVIHGDGVVCIYTGNVKGELSAREAYQCAFSMTESQTGQREPMWEFAKWPSNPIIPTIPEGYTGHFRDPMIFATPTGANDRYRMSLGAQRANETGAIALYSSVDLNTWTFDGELSFTGPGAVQLEEFGYMWECPNIFQIWDEVQLRERTVVLWCPQGLDRTGERFQSRYQCGYVVGDLDGNVLRNCTEFIELDLGTEFYAPQVFAGLDNEHILMGWAGNAEEDDLPTLQDAGWVHALTLPRKLRLIDGHLHQLPAAAPERFGNVIAQPCQVAPAQRQDTNVSNLSGVQAWRLQYDAQYQQGMRLEISAGGYRVAVRFTGGVVSVDRSHTRYLGSGDNTSAIRTVTFAPGWNPGDRVAVDIVHDHSITEMYINDGHTVLTWRTILGSDEPQVALEVDNGAATGTVIYTCAD